MKTCKRFLSLALSLVLLLGLLLTPAGAAGFTDAGLIRHTQAVDRCVTLKIINGYGDNSFRPHEGITRAEMCKMIAAALTGGKGPGGSYAVPFRDVDSSAWAANYIGYCSSKGIVSGTGGGAFAPNANVTGDQAMKMLLVALGYSGSKYTGGGWSAAVRTDAAKAGLTQSLGSLNGSVPLSRDDAAQLIWNALQAKPLGSSQTLLYRSYGNVDFGGSTTSKPTQFTAYIGMSKSQVTQLWGSDYARMDWTLMGAEEGIYYADLRVPVVFYFNNGKVSSVDCSALPRAGFTLTEKLKGGESFNQMKNLGLPVTLLTDPDQLGADIEEVGAVYYRYSSACTIYFSWQDGDPRTTAPDTVVILTNHP